MRFLSQPFSFTGLCFINAKFGSGVHYFKITTALFAIKTELAKNFLVEIILATFPRAQWNYSEVQYWMGGLLEAHVGFQ